MLFSSTIGEVFLVPRREANKVDPDAIGVELEMELKAPLSGEQQRYIQELGIQVKNDGSLRNFGYEFVSKPFSFKKKDEFLGSWNKVWDGPAKFLQKNLIDSTRTSVHVHVNVRDKTYLQLMNILTAWAICEGPMVTWCGPTRLGNLFALRIPEAPTVFHTGVANLKNYEPFKIGAEERYYAFNMASLFSFGTVEFRSLRGVYDPEVIDTWIKAIYNLVDVASNEFKTPLEIVQYFLATPNANFLHRFCGDIARHITNLPKPNFQMMDEGYEMALALVSAHPDGWECNPETDWRNDEVMQKWFKEREYSAREKFWERKVQYAAVLGKGGKPKKNAFKPVDPALDWLDEGEVHAEFDDPMVGGHAEVAANPFADNNNWMEQEIARIREQGAALRGRNRVENIAPGIVRVDPPLPNWVVENIPLPPLEPDNLVNFAAPPVPLAPRRRARNPR